MELLDTFRADRTVIIAGTDRAWVESARTALAADATITVETINDATDVAALVDVADRVAPDVVLLAGGDDLTPLFRVAGELSDRLPGTAIMVVSSTGTALDSFANAALDAGVVAAWAADRPLTELADAIHALARGGSMLPASWAGQALAVYRALQSAPAAGTTRPVLSADEAAVLEALAEGAPEMVVAVGARVPLRKVRVHAGNAWRKLICFRDDQRFLNATS